MNTGLFLSVVALAILTGTRAQAAGGRDYEITYYNEHDLKNQVGMFSKPCGNGAPKLTGRRTPYFTKSQTTCPGGAHPPPSTTVSCHFTEAGCTDTLARVISKKLHKTPTKVKKRRG